MAFGFPPAVWLRTLTPGQIRGDLLAGLTLAAYLVPAALGDASLAGLPPQAGLYACLGAGLVFWLFCASRQTAVSVTSAISLLVGSTLGVIAQGDPQRFAALAAGTALIAGFLAFLAWLLHAGVLVEFISETVLTGFKLGIGLTLIATQVPKLLGITSAHGGNFVTRCWQIAIHLNEINWVAFALGGTSLLLLIGGKRWLPHRPIAILIVVGAILLVGPLHLVGQGVATLGVIPGGAPSPVFFPLGYADLNEILPLAMACFLLAAVETIAVGRMFAARTGQPFDPNQEFLGLAAANTTAGILQGLPVGGGMSQSLVNAAGGARSPLAGLFAAVVILGVLLTCAGILHGLPQPVLAAIVLVAVAGLIQVEVLGRLWHFDRREFALAVIVVIAVLLSGILRGILIGAAVSLVMMLQRTARPRVTELGRVPGTEVFADAVRHPENLPVPGVLVLRLEGPLVYFNARHVHDRLQAAVAEHAPVPLVVLSLGMTAQIDLAGAELLSLLHHDLAQQGVTLRLAEVHGQIRDTLRHSGFTPRCGPVEQNQTVATVLAAWRREPPTAARS
jgi:sulfate permease, SulP family